MMVELEINNQTEKLELELSPPVGDWPQLRCGPAGPDIPQIGRRLGNRISCMTVRRGGLMPRPGMLTWETYDTM